jgi:hypothetical protein
VAEHSKKESELKSRWLIAQKGSWVLITTQKGSWAQIKVAEHSKWKLGPNQGG